MATTWIPASLKGWSISWFVYFRILLHSFQLCEKTSKITKQVLRRKDRQNNERTFQQNWVSINQYGLLTHLGETHFLRSQEESDRHRLQIGSGRFKMGFWKEWKWDWPYILLKVGCLMDTYRIYRIQFCMFFIFKYLVYFNWKL